MRALTIVCLLVCLIVSSVAVANPRGGSRGGKTAAIAAAVIIGALLLSDNDAPACTNGYSYGPEYGTGYSTPSYQPVPGCGSGYNYPQQYPTSGYGGYAPAPVYQGGYDQPFAGPGYGNQYSPGYPGFNCDDTWPGRQYYSREWIASSRCQVRAIRSDGILVSSVFALNTPLIVFGSGGSQICHLRVTANGNDGSLCRFVGGQMPRVGAAVAPAF